MSWYGGEPLTPAERRRWGMFLIVGDALRMGMLPVDQEPGKVAIFERPIQNAPYIVLAIPNHRPPSFTFDPREIDPFETAYWREVYETLLVYMGPRPAGPWAHPADPYYAYAVSREELDKLCAKRNAEAEAKRNPVDKSRAIDAYVVGEEPGLVKAARPQVHCDYGFPDRHPRPVGWFELRQVRVRREEREALHEQGLHRLGLPGKVGG